MTEEQKYLFDLNGFLVVPGVLTASECQTLREFVVTLNQQPHSLPDHERYAALDPDPVTLHLVSGPSSELLDHPVLVDILDDIVVGDHGSEFRTADAHPFRFESTWCNIKAAGECGVPPHGAPGVDPLFVYICQNQRIYAGMLRVVWELNPVGPEDEATTFAPGSHKANFPTPVHLLEHGSPIMKSYTCPQGSLVIFTEAVTHAGGRWRNADTPRIAIMNSYCPITAQWHRFDLPAEVIEKLPAKRRTLFRGVWGTRRFAPTVNDFYGPDNVAV